MQMQQFESQTGRTTGAVCVSLCLYVCVHKQSSFFTIGPGEL